MRQHRNLRAPPLSTGWFRFQIDHHTCSFSNTSIGLKKNYQLLRSIWFPESLNVLRYLSVVFPSVLMSVKIAASNWRFCFVFHNWILLKFSPFLYVCVTWGSVCASPVGPAKLHYWWRWLSLFLPLSLSLSFWMKQKSRTKEPTKSDIEWGRKRTLKSRPDERRDWKRDEKDRKM